MNTFTEKIRLVFQDPVLRKRIFITLGLLIAFRVLAAIPIPGINVSQLNTLFAGNQFLGLLNVFSGGGLSQLSIVMLGVGPYITGTIIMQLLTLLSPKLKAMYQEEGEAGRMKFAQYSRMLTIPLAMIQAFGFLVLLERSGIISTLGTFDLIRNIAIVTAGSTFLMWIGERITEFGVGNGTSLIIFAGIIARLPSNISQAWFTADPLHNPSQIPSILAILIGAVIITYAVVFITESERPIPVTYAKRVRGNKVYGGISTYLPLRLTQAGVIPIIFALSLLLFPQVIFQFLTAIHNGIIQAISQWVLNVLQNQWLYAILYFILVFAFTYFYTAITFDPHMIAENLQKNGAFIPGVRPGQPTAAYVSWILNRLTAFGGLFLGVVAVLPLIVKGMTGIASLAIGGTALLIVVSVIVDLIKQIDAQVSMREY
jgi:preprotein translocase subunit SecY